MPSLNDPSLMREIIMDHYEYPRNKRKVNDDRYITIHMDSASCIDDIYVQVLIENGIIKDICFDGIACTISTASTSIMTELVKNKTINEAKKIIENYENMIFEKDYDENLLEEAVVFKNTHKQASRIKCATIGWNGLKQVLEEIEKK